MAGRSTETRPWYRQGWPWFLIALPASAVIGGIATIIIAIQSPHALVVDDYYKEGLAINRVKHRQEAAEQMHLTGLLRSDGRQLTLQLDSREPVTDANLQLRIAHATRAELDRQLTLHRLADGRYGTDAEPLPPGVWYLRLQNPDHSWEIRARIVTDGAFQARLSHED
ncbi:MAG TPA: hypothetical protein ENK05_13915 [Gammaproteobacteria bacterium]|nr:hypothetical protein [Gammaproteobacteria bacterium]